MSVESSNKEVVSSKSEPERGYFASVLRWLQDRFADTKPVSFRGQLEQVLRRHKDSDESFSVPERTMLRNVLRFGALRVEDVMVPRADIIAIDEASSVEELMRLFETAGHSRIPVYREALDEPLGMVHVKDLFRWVMDRSSVVTDENGKKGNGSNGNGNGSSGQNGGKSNGSTVLEFQGTHIDLQQVDLTGSVAATKVRRNVLFVPPSMPVADLLLRMQSSHVHLALVVDEYGGTDGLVSIEDLVEEIVGEIEDEHDVADGPLMRRAGPGRYIADARTPIEDLQEQLDVDLSLSDKDEDEIDTLGGLVFSIAGRVPLRGELIKHPSGLEFEVLEADPRRIKRLRVHQQSGAKAAVEAR